MTNKKTDAEALLALVEDSNTTRTKIGRLRGLFEEIEVLQSQGVSNTAIVGKLNELKFKVTLKAFEMMLYRIRKEQGKGKNSPLVRGGEAEPKMNSAAAKPSKQNQETPTPQETTKDEQGTKIGDGELTMKQKLEKIATDPNEKSRIQDKYF